MKFSRLVVSAAASIAFALACPVTSLADAPAAPTIASPADGSTTGRSVVLNFTTDPSGEVQCRFDDGDWGVCPGLGDGTRYTVGWDTVLHWGEHSTDSMWAVGSAPNTPGCLAFIGGVCWVMPIEGVSAPTLNSFFTGLTSSATCADSVAQMNTFGGYFAFGSFDTAGGGTNLLAHNKFSLNCDSTLAQVSGKLTNVTTGTHSLDVRVLDPSTGDTSQAARSEWTVGDSSDSTATSQSDSDGNVFVNGDVLEFGAKANGSFGTTNSAPAGFHERTQSDEDSGKTNGLGFVAPANPVTKDWSNELGDFFTPGGPYEGWRLTANGDVAANYNGATDIEGSWDSVAAGAKTATWHSSSPFHGLDITQTYSVSGTDQLIQGTVTLTNNSSEPVNDVAYARGVDPDNCVMDSIDNHAGPFYDTKNTTYSQWADSTSHLSIITAEASCNNETQISLASGDPESRVGTHYEGWARTRNPFDLLNDDGTNYSVDQGTVVNDDADLNLAIPANPDHHNTLQPGQSVTLHFAYSLSRAALTSLGAAAVAPPALTDHPDKITNSTSATFNLGGASDATWDCSLDAVSVDCSGGSVTLTDLDEGSHTFKAAETVPGLGASDPTVYKWTVDTASPGAPTVSAAPTSPSNHSLVTFTFSGEAGARFTCSYDGSGAADCGSEWSTSPTDGTHTLVVKQVDRAGNSGEAVTRTWTTDTTAPNAPTVSAAPESPTHTDINLFTFSGEDGATFECTFDDGEFEQCASPLGAGNSTNGEHAFGVRQVDAAGNRSDITWRTWTFERLDDTEAPAAPGVSGIPTVPIPRATATVTLTGEDNATFNCSLDGAAYAVCASPLQLTGLAIGNHVLLVTQTDQAGNTSPATTKRWTVRQPCVIPVVKLAIFKYYGHGSYWLRSRAAVGDVRPACQLLTLQVWDSRTKPADSDHLTATPSLLLRISKYSSLVKFNYGKTFTPRWIRVENKVGTWSSWYPIPTGTR